MEKFFSLGGAIASIIGAALAFANFKTDVSNLNLIRTSYNNISRSREDLGELNKKARLKPIFSFIGMILFLLLAAYSANTYISNTDDQSYAIKDKNLKEREAAILQREASLAAKDTIIEQKRRDTERQQSDIDRQKKQQDEREADIVRRKRDQDEREDGIKKQQRLLELQRQELADLRKSFGSRPAPPNSFAPPVRSDPTPTLPNSSASDKSKPSFRINQALLTGRQINQTAFDLYLEIRYSVMNSSDHEIEWLQLKKMPFASSDTGLSFNEISLDRTTAPLCNSSSQTDATSCMTQFQPLPIGLSQRRTTVRFFTSGGTNMCDIRNIKNIDISFTMASKINGSPVYTYIEQTVPVTGNLAVSGCYG